MIHSGLLLDFQRFCARRSVLCQLVLIIQTLMYNAAQWLTESHIESRKTSFNYK